MTERDPITGRFVARPVDLTKGMTGKQMDAYHDANTALSRAVRRAESDAGGKT